MVATELLVWDTWQQPRVIDIYFRDDGGRLRERDLGEHHAGYLVYTNVNYYYLISLFSVRYH